jgi:glycosyltransferase involved in cell wall biosynthesis
LDTRAPVRLKIALVANTSWYLHNFRPTLMDALQQEGHEVVAVAPDDAYSRKLVEAGFAHHHIPLDQKSINPIRALQSILHLRRVFRKERVDAVLSFTPKGNIYSGLAIADRSVTFVANLSGLGRAFSKDSRVLGLTMMGFKWAFLRATAVLFQNGDDLRLLVNRGIVDAAKARRIPGSGVNLQRFSFRNSTRERDGANLEFLFVGRLLWEKGIGEFVKAAQRLKSRYPRIRFRALGPLEQGPSGVPQATLDAWARDGVIDYLGVAEYVRGAMEAADCIVLPSYYNEGVPRSLLEAAALGRPVITTNMAGCRDAVCDGATGFLCNPRDVDGLVAAVEKFILLPMQERKEMGRRGREKMELEFDESFVIDQYKDLVSRTTSKNASSTNAMAAAKLRPAPRRIRR